MRTLREAAAILSKIVSLDDLALLLPALGFEAAAATLDRDSIRSLGLDSLVASARISRGSGTLRALLIDTRDQLPLRESTRRIAEKLARSSPHVLWLLLVLQSEQRVMALAAWTSGQRSTRTAALLVELNHVVDSDAETICAVAAIRDSVDVLVHSRWVELLGRDALTRRFYRTLEQIVRNMSATTRNAGRLEERDELALLHVSRLLFLSFLEAKGWLDGDRGFLMRSFNECMSRGGDYYNRVLLPLFFGTLNTPVRKRSAAARQFGRVPFLNGGLFARTITEKLHSRAAIPDEVFGELFGTLLSRYRFTAREDSTSWSEAAIDPEMLGKSFESLMLPRSRHASGAFYTPQQMVEHVTHTVLLDAICMNTGVPVETINVALSGEIIKGNGARKVAAAVQSIRILDPACGSGAFLVHVLEKLGTLIAATGDSRPVAEVRRAVLGTSIFGVDINPMAVWLCELRLWLSIAIASSETDPLAVMPLPNLDHNVRVGDSLGGGDFSFTVSGTRGAEGGAFVGSVQHAISGLRNRYMGATGHRKQTLGRTLDHVERKQALATLQREMATVSARRKDIVEGARSRTLFGERAHLGKTQSSLQQQLREKARRLRTSFRNIERGGALPFSFASHFPEAAAAGGFDVVLGNPPWVRVERIPEEARTAMRRDFDVFRLALWQPSITRDRPAPTFSPQVDLAALFVERSISLLKPQGSTSLILPAKLWHSLAGSGLRQILRENTTIVELEDWSESMPAFDAVVYPSVIVARRESDKRLPLVAGLRSRDNVLRWSVDPARMQFDSSPGSPWLIIPDEVRGAFNLLTARGTPLGSSQLGVPRMGIKCGRNDAFIVNLQSRDENAARIKSGDRIGRVESNLLRPVLRGEGVRRWRSSHHAEHVVWTHGEDGDALTQLPPLARRWFMQWRFDLTRRSDLRDQARWWSLFRTESARSDCWRVVWADIGLAPRAAVLPPHNSAVPLNSCYVVLLPDATDAYAFAALLNNPLSAAWLNILAEQARGGYRRYFSWTMSLLPIPRRWTEVRERLADCARRACEGADVPDSLLLEESLKAYELDNQSVAPLLTWNNR